METTLKNTPRELANLFLSDQADENGEVKPIRRNCLRAKLSKFYKLDSSLESGMVLSSIVLEIWETTGWDKWETYEQWEGTPDCYTLKLEQNH